MYILLDAHALLWWVTDSPRLGRSARKAIADPANQVAVGIGALWEIIIKRSRGRLYFPFDFETVLQDEGFAVLPVQFAHLRALDTLPHHHGDPFDRLLIAQALAQRIPIASGDRSFAAYGVEIVW
ncbi:MAG: type II toxin-antitoxin system VapC family toxin [Stellaceae bacterium]